LPPETPEDPVLRQISGMTANEKIGQLFVLAFRNGETQKEIESVVAEYNLGGIILFGENIETKDQVKNLIEGAKSAAKIPMIVGVDEEGGAVSRLGKLYEKIPAAAELARSGEVYAAYSEISRRLIELGFNADFAPVADVNSNPLNAVIGDRAFSSDANEAAQAVAESVKSFNDAGVICVLKHFPGHGDTTEDTHYGLTKSRKTLEELEKTEFIPFIEGIKAGAPAVMVSHIVVPGIDEPASLSREIITDVLRNKLGFDGLVIVDALDMRAVTDYYSPEEACYKAFKAGADLLLMPADFKPAYSYMLNSYKAGNITEEELTASLYRILAIKQKI
jgi:beta-N-acetylhexosaminidase